MDFFGFDLTSDTASWLGLPGILRVAEASDSIEGLVNSAKADTGREVIGFLLCSIVSRTLVPRLLELSLTHTSFSKQVEFGGVLYVLVVLVLLTALLPCLQISSFFAGIIVDVIVLVTSKSEKKDEEEKEGKKETNEQKQKKEKEKKEKEKKKTKLPSFPGGMSSRFKAMRGRTGATETLPLSMFENTSPESDSDDDMRGRV